MLKSNLFLSLITGVLLSMVVSKIVYFGFTPNYAADIFSHQAFNLRFQHDVYQYRILCKYLLLEIDKWLKPDIPDNVFSPRLEVNTPSSSFRFYVAFYYLNTFFLVLTSITASFLLFLDKSFRFNDPEKMLIVFLVPLTIAITEFTVCFYDVSSYFFQLLILFVYLRFIAISFWFSIVAMSLLIIVSTLNRESSALSVSLIGVLLLTRYGLSGKTLLAIGIPSLSFLATYWWLHHFIVDPKHWQIFNYDVGQYFMGTNFIGILFWCIFFILPLSISNSIENRWLIGAFFLFSLPYVYTCLKGGVLWEVRLYVPMFLSSLFLSKLDVSGHRVKISSLMVQKLKRKLTKSASIR